VAPLGLYLLSFVIAFAARRGLSEFLTMLAPLILLIAGAFAFAENSRHPLFAGSLGLSLLFVVAVALHGEMYRSRPAPGHLTAFYLAMAAGGVVGGLFCAILAPTLFDWTYEHPILILAAALLLPQEPLIGALRRMWAERGRARLLLAFAIPSMAAGFSWLFSRHFHPQISETEAYVGMAAIALLAIISLGRPWIFAICLGALMLCHGGWATLAFSLSEARSRSYFGVYTVSDRRDGRTRQLSHGTTLHGVQSLLPGQETEPTSYYGRRSGVGIAMASAERLYGANANIGIVGLGTGTLACYRRPGQHWRFFEIDPNVVRISRESGYFSFLFRCAPDVDIVIGDARLTLSAEPPGRLDILAVDAFSSDAVPMHLLTHEALAVYGRALAPDGILLIHISNRFIDLQPVLAAGAAVGGWHTALRDDYIHPTMDPDNLNSSIWVALSRDRAKLEMLKSASPEDPWYDPEHRPGFEGWSDDHASILPLLKSLWP
jgi:SAM-dependent methyltransferase